MTAVHPTGPTSRTGPFRVLVVVPTLGERLPTLARTLDSVRQQAGVPVDCVVVAKTLTPELQTVVEARGARLITDEGRVSAAINAGFSQAGPEHRYCCWIGDDDLLRPDSLRSASTALEADPRAVVAFGRCDYIDFAGNLLFTRRPPPGAAALLQLVPGLIKQETCLFRQAAVAAVGGLDENVRYAMDLDLLLRLRRQGSFARLESVQAAFCWHPGSITIANRDVSFKEAQEIQARHARGLVSLAFALLKAPIRKLVLVVNGRINRAFLPPVGAQPAAGKGER